MPTKIDPTTDYYAILGVTSHATPAQIKSAYREKTKRVHPDRGGSHHQMVELIAAYEFLSDPALRAEYDALRAHPNDPVATQRWEPVVRQAYAKAENTVRDHGATPESFERWVQSVTGDFTNAIYGQEELVPGVIIPTVGKSISGHLFFWMGVVLMFLVFCLIFPLYRTAVYRLVTLDDAQTLFPKVPGILNIVLLALPLFLGAWLGVWVHKKVGRVFAGIEAAPNSPPTVRVIPCLHCGQKMRLPVLGTVVIATCPRCRTRTEVTATAYGNSEQDSTSSRNSSAQLPLAARLIVAYAVFMHPVLWLIENAICAALMLVNPISNKQLLWGCVGAIFGTAITVILLTGGIKLWQRRSSGIALLKAGTGINLIVLGLWFVTLLTLAFTTTGSEVLRHVAFSVAVNFINFSIQSLICLLALVWLTVNTKGLHAATLHSSPH